MGTLKKPKRLKSFQTESHARSPEQEDSLAKRVGGRRVKGSGCGFEKGDVRVEGFVRIEAKTTKHKSFSVTIEMLDKIEDAALSAGEVPAMVIEFRQDRDNREVAVIPVWALEKLIGGQGGS